MMALSSFNPRGLEPQVGLWRAVMQAAKPFIQRHGVFAKVHGVIAVVQVVHQLVVLDLARIPKDQRVKARAPLAASVAGLAMFVGGGVGLGPGVSPFRDYS